MLRIYLKQAWSLLKENPLVSGLSIAGTALAITAVMMIILVIQVRLQSMHRRQSVVVCCT